VATLMEIERTARRVFGGAHPLAAAIGQALPRARDALRATERRRDEREELPAQVEINIRDLTAGVADL